MRCGGTQEGETGQPVGLHLGACLFYKQRGQISIGARRMSSELEAHCVVSHAVPGVTSAR